MQVRYKVFKGQRRFGIEVEGGNNITKTAVRKAITDVSAKVVQVGEWGQTIGNNFWMIKPDSTCGPTATSSHKDYGWEIVSFVGTGVKDILEISKTMDAVRVAGLELNKNCGLHIHAEVKDFTASKCGGLMARWIKIEHLMMCLANKHRTNNKHCVPWTKYRPFKLDQKYTKSQLWGLCRPSNFAASENPQKRVTLNLVNFAQALHYEDSGSHWDRKTIELRLPESTLDPCEIVHWTKLYLNFVDSSRLMKMPDNLAPVQTIREFLELLGLSGTSSFYLLSPGLYRTKLWVLNKLRDSWAWKEGILDKKLLVEIGEIEAAMRIPKIQSDG